MIPKPHHRAKLGAEQVAKMRRMYRRNVVGYRVLAQEFGCGMSTVRDIVQYRTRAAA